MSLENVKLSIVLACAKHAACLVFQSFLAFLQKRILIFANIYTWTESVVSFASELCFRAV